jgi:uncharacterized membrane protein
MTFEHPWLLLAALLPIAWAVYAWRGSARRGALALKALALACIALALAQPRLTVFESKIAVAVLADTSASIPPDDLKRESELAAAIERARGRNWTQVIPFAETTRPVQKSEGGKGLHLRQTPGEAGHGTDIEAALRAGIAALPAGRVPRLALISDGRENLGSVARAAWQARQLGIPINTFALAGRPKPDLRLESVTLPAHAFTGERFPIDVAVRSPSSARATVRISAEGKVLGSSQVALEPGINQLRVHASLAAAGAVDLSGSISAAQLGEVRFDQALTLRRPRVLYLSQDPAGTETHLLQTLEAGQFEVQRAAAIPADLSDYQLLAINNWNLEAIPAVKKANIEEFVKQGGGVLIIGGERNIYVDKKGQPEDALERTLPAKLAPPRAPEGTCVVLILDKSSSMEGKKMELARLAAIGVVENLRPIDMVGVLIFDNSFHWSVPLRRAEEKSLIKRVIAGITPDGGTQIAPALQEAYRRILQANAVYKHIVLLTDGISEEGDSMQIARDAAARQVTISTVGLGQDVNRAYLEKVAVFARGKSYFLMDPSGLEQILLRDVMEHTGSTAVERDLRPRVVKNAEILEGVGIESAPALAGYVRFIARPGADVVLTSDRDPLLVRWQYGLGRAEIFASDAKSRWARQWVSWDGYDRFWANVFRDLLPHGQAGEATVEYNSANDELVVDYRLGRYVEEPDRIPDIFVFGAQGFQRTVKVDKTAEGAFRGRVKIDNRQGLFRIRPLAESRAFPEVGFYRQEEEMHEYGSNEGLLRQISEFTGGRFQGRPRDVFDSGGRTVASTLRLWPGLLAAALLLNLLELILRKWRGLTTQLRGKRGPAAPRPAPAAETTSVG